MASAPNFPPSRPVNASVRHPIEFAYSIARTTFGEFPEPLIAAGRLYAVADAPRYPHPTYMVYPKEFDNPVISLALDGLRSLTRSA